MMHVRDILSTVGDVQYCGGYHDKCEGYLEYRGGYLEYCRGSQYRGGYHDAYGGYHEYRGGINLLLFEYPHGTQDIPPR